MHVQRYTPQDTPVTGLENERAPARLPDRRAPHSPPRRPRAISRLRAHVLQQQDDPSLLKSCRNTGGRMPFALRSATPQREV
jgi:hypothetical protein